MRDHPDAALAFERRIELIGAEGGIGNIGVAFRIEPHCVDQHDRAAVDLLEQRALAGIDLAEHLAVVVERDQLGAQVSRVLDHLSLGIDHGCRPCEREDRAGRELSGGDRQHAHAERRGQILDQPLVDHDERAVRLHCELADVALALGETKVLAAVADLGGVGDEHGLAVCAEDGALRIVERLQHLKDRCRHRVDRGRDVLALHRSGTKHGGECNAAQKPFAPHDYLPLSSRWLIRRNQLDISAECDGGIILVDRMKNIRSSLSGTLKREKA